MAKKPVIKSGPASNHAGPCETILEFNSGVPNGPGGLLSLTRNGDGTLTVSLYRLDSGVTVTVTEPED